MCLPIPPSGRGLLCSWQLLRRQGAGVARRGPSRYTAPGSAVTERPVKEVRPCTAVRCPGHAAGLRLGIAEDGDGPPGRAREGVTGCQAAAKGDPRKDALGARRPWRYPVRCSPPCPCRYKTSARESVAARWHPGIGHAVFVRVRMSWPGRGQLWAFALQRAALRPDAPVPS